MLLWTLNGQVEQNGERPSNRWRVRDHASQSPTTPARQSTSPPKGEGNHQKRWEMKINPISQQIGRQTSQSSHLRQVHLNHFGGTNHSPGLQQPIRVIASSAVLQTPCTQPAQISSRRTQALTQIKTSSELIHPHKTPCKRCLTTTTEPQSPAT